MDANFPAPITPTLIGPELSVCWESSEYKFIEIHSFVRLRPSAGDNDC